MTDHKDDLAPERIGLISDPLGTGLWALATRDEADIAIHYIRADLAQSALDAALLAAKEAGFWIGRSTGGSRAEIDAALAEIRGDTQ